MNHKGIFSFCVAAALIGGSLNANAQFGKLKGLADKAKSAAKDKASDAKNNAVESAKNSAGNAVGLNTPSADGVVWHWDGRLNELGDWEKHMVFDGNRKGHPYMQQVKIHMDIFGQVLSRLGSTTLYGYRDYITFGPDKKKAFPLDEVPRYAWTKAFVENPTVDNFKVFAMTLLYSSPLYMLYLQYPMDNASSGVVNTEKGWMLEWPSESDMNSERSAREDYAIELAKKKISLKDICDYTCLQYERAEAALEKPSVSLAHGFFLAEQLKKRLVDEHPDYNASAECVRKVEALASKWEANNRKLYQEMVEKCGVDGATPQPLPTGVSVSADIKSNGDAAAKKWAAAKKMEYVKTIYLAKSWRAFKSLKFPYNVTHHSIDVVVVLKTNGKTVMQRCDLQKSLQGQYGVVPALGSKLLPVK